MKTTNAYLAAVLLTWGFLGCTPVQPYRTTHVTPPPDCPITASGAAPGACKASIHEHTEAYDLLFVEFDDQGLQYPKELKEAGEAWHQIDLVMAQLRSLSEQYEGLSLIVFVHGWKHNAATDDSNVMAMRRMLHHAELAERESIHPHRVVGIYVSWRGLSVTAEPLEEASFWDRKFTASKVAAGSARALFSRLKGFQCDQNDPRKEGKCRPGEITQRPKVRLLMIGHSFGALVLYSAISESLIEDLTFDEDSGFQEAPPVRRFGNLVVLLNPAFEATRYTPLHRIATNRQYAKYQAPILVSITSTADWATGSAFPLGRFFDTIFEATASAEESKANRNTIGHMDLYITHKLLRSKEEPSTCAGWGELNPSKPDDWPRQMKENLTIERKNDEAFFGKRDSAKDILLPEHWARPFCDRILLTHTQYDPNSPVWNVVTDREIIADHDDITGPVLINFLRQLYRDTVTYPMLKQ